MDSMKDLPIGFCDSGLGGLSVLKKGLEILPNEKFIYYGDSLNAPYGVKPLSEVKKLTFDAIKFLINKGVKAVVIACNTATAVAIEDLRREYNDMIIIGIEPAVKPAIENHKKGKIIIMATKLALTQKGYNENGRNHEGNIEIIPMHCSKLVELVESGKTKGKEVEDYFRHKFKDIDISDIETVVLGCTHYPFAREALRNVLGDKVNIIDGSEGTIKQLKRRLSQENLLNEQGEQTIEIYNSLNDKHIIYMSEQLINM